MLKYFLYIVLSVCRLCSAFGSILPDSGVKLSVRCGDEKTEVYFPMLKDRRIAIFTNHTGLAGDKHIVDLLAAAGFDIKLIFAPEHGFRGDVGAGEKISDAIDSATGLPVVSLYGLRGSRPDAETMQKFDILIVDIQDVGLRFYTYYITMLRLMEACAETGKEMLLLDRPNPNGFYVDGPVLERKHYSGVGCLPIPVVHGMTLGELALMINGEGWLRNGNRCRLQVVECENYTHATIYSLPVAPSPNLPTMQSVWLYPSICLFEGTVASLGRGTDFPFQVYGHPAMQGDFLFTPRSRKEAKNPPCRNRQCRGVDLRSMSAEQCRDEGFTLRHIIDARKKMPEKTDFFTPFFEKLVGVDYVREMIEKGCSESEIRSKWQEDVNNFKLQRAKYLIYPES